MFISILTILIGAVLTAGGAQELIVQGIFNNRRYPLLGGALGAVAAFQVRTRAELSGNQAASAFQRLTSIRPAPR